MVDSLCKMVFTQLVSLENYFRMVAKNMSYECFNALSCDNTVTRGYFHELNGANIMQQ